MPGVAVNFAAKSPYLAMTDSQGRFTIANVLPGPYRLAATDSVWLDFGAGAGAPRPIVVPQTGRVDQVRLEIEKPEEVLEARCRKVRDSDQSKSMGPSLVVGHVLDAAGRPVETTVAAVPLALGGRGSNSSVTTARGAFALCGLFPRPTALVVYLSDGKPFETLVDVPSGRILNVTIRLPPR